MVIRYTQDSNGKWSFNTMFPSLSSRVGKAQGIYNKTGQVRVEVDLGRSIGEGYLKGGTAYTQTNRAIVRFDKSGRPFTAFPALR